MTTIPDYCPKCLFWMSQHIDGECPERNNTNEEKEA